MEPPQNAASLAEFRRFRDLPPELRVMIWRLISLPEPLNKAANKYKAVNIFPQCEGQRSHHSCTRTPTSLEKQLTQIWRKVKYQNTPLPITTKINRESRAETFKYWVIELYPKRGLPPFCFLPTHHEIEVNICCFIEPRRGNQRNWNSMTSNQQLDATNFGKWEFRRWIQHLKREHPRQIEKIHEIHGELEDSRAVLVLSQLADCIMTYRARLIRNGLSPDLVN
jgi:hypothetical protein